MPGKKLSAGTIKTCYLLRSKDHLSLNEISKKTGVSKSTLSIMLRSIPLPDAVRKNKIREGIIKTNRCRKKDRGIKSKYQEMVENKELSRLEKNKISESAILFRLSLFGFIIYGSPFGGDKADWVIENPDISGNIFKIQVKWIRESKSGLPHISIKCTEGHDFQRRYVKEEFDFIVGYRLFNDTAYVYSFEELSQLKSGVTISDNAAEAWDKIKL